ncbi:PREDICTED: transmembrane protein 14C-like [Rhagoletis zephyria]|uniref:transmembrane protein 14C-like n=1 Tax=Rhagoletis zephyria TaxID=28612 RepID=UPI0008114117|nr:PREDICTED: transmembrane protein 14C-like [Rhagoletis zephyria]
MPVDILSILYAGTVALGGAIGYATKGSIPSLVAGLSFGAILGVGAWQTSVNPRNYWLITVTSLVLSGMMGYRFYGSKKFMPAGLVFTLATLMVIRFGLRFVTGRNYF